MIFILNEGEVLETNIQNIALNAQWKRNGSLWKKSLNCQTNLKAAIFAQNLNKNRKVKTG